MEDEEMKMDWEWIETKAEGLAWWFHDHARWTNLCILFERISRWAYYRACAIRPPDGG